MFPTIDETRRLLENLSESYAVEVKRWIDPSQPEGKEKLVKALLALRNNGGGRLVIGFDNASMKPVSEGRPSSVRTTFDQDEIQALVSRFASEPFEVLVQYVELGNEEFPVVCAPTGVRTPVATKSELKDAANQRVLVPLNGVYARTLSTNNTVSSGLAQWRDWDRLVEICFDNREADIGRFVRRHLADDTISTLFNAMADVSAPPERSATATACEFIDVGRAAFERAVERRGIKLPTVGYVEIAAVIDGRLKAGLAPNQAMLNLITTSNRHFTGWPMFAALSNADVVDLRPQVVDDAWETAAIRPSGDPWGFNGIDSGESSTTASCM